MRSVTTPSFSRGAQLDHALSCSNLTKISENCGEVVIDVDRRADVPSFHVEINGIESISLFYFEVQSMFPQRSVAKRIYILLPFHDL